MAKSSTAAQVRASAQVKPVAGRITRLFAVQILLLGLHLLCTAAILPTPKLGDWPILRLDYSYHYSQAAEVSELVAEQGRAWGYSDLFFAGYPLGVTSNLGSKGWTWFVYLLSYVSIPAVTAFNLYVVLWLVLTPLLIYQACRWFRMSPAEATGSTVLAMIYWWSSTFYWFLYLGMLSFLASAPLAMFSIAAMYACVREQRWQYGIAFGLSAAICGWVHPLSAIFLIAGGTIVYVTHLRHLTLAQHGGLLLLCGLVALSQWPWAGPLLATRSWFAKSNAYLTYWQPVGSSTPHPNSLSNQNIPLSLWLAYLGALLTSLYLWRRNRKMAYLFLAALVALLVAGMLVDTPMHRLFLVGAAVGVYAWWRQRRLGLAVLFIILPAMLLYLGYLRTAFGALQPARNLPVGYLWLALPAAAGGRYVYTIIRESRQRWRLVGAGLVLLALSLWPVITPEYTLLFAEEPFALIQPPSKEASDLLRWLKTNTSRDGRILFEDSQYWAAEYGVTAGYLAYSSQRSFIGGPFPWGGPVDFIDGRPFDRPIETMTTSEMADYLSLYNVHWVIVHSQASQSFFDAQSDLVEPMDDLGFARTYRVISPGNYFLEGTGQVTIRNHQIELQNVQGAEVVLKYHWIPNLKSEPEALVERAMIPPDPHGFIKLVAPPERLTLRVAP